VTATVLESHEHGPQFCAEVLDSYPPQCGGPAVIGFDWSIVSGATSANGSTWGEYTLVGTWDGTALTLTQAPTDGASGPSSPAPLPDFSTPCQVPDGGWKVVEPSLIGMTDYEHLSTAAQSQPDIGGMWVDQSINPAGPQNDFAKSVVNVSFTGDLERHERALRAVWGGPLCVSKAAISATTVASRRTDVQGEVGSFLFSSTDERSGTIEIAVWLDDRGLQARFDRRYGPGAVRITSLLQPVGT